jgi:uncharacterized membrane protein SpoIIM required for sporulation
MKSIYIGDLSYALRLMIGSFLVVLSVGFFTGISFVGQTDSMTPEGMVENYNGNADQDDAMVMKFKKSPREMLTIIHTHVLSLSFIFFLTGVLLGFSRINKRIQIFLMVEPFVSVLLTFGYLFGLVGLRMGKVYSDYIWNCYDDCLYSECAHSFF